MFRSLTLEGGPFYFLAVSVGPILILILVLFFYHHLWDLEIPLVQAGQFEPNKKKKKKRKGEREGELM